MSNIIIENLLNSRSKKSFLQQIDDNQINKHYNIFFEHSWGERTILGHFLKSLSIDIEDNKYSNYSKLENKIDIIIEIIENGGNLFEKEIKLNNEEDINSLMHYSITIFSSKLTNILEAENTEKLNKKVQNLFFAIDKQAKERPNYFSIDNFEKITQALYKKHDFFGRKKNNTDYLFFLWFLYNKNNPKKEDRDSINIKTLDLLNSISRDNYIEGSQTYGNNRQRIIYKFLKELTPEEKKKTFDFLNLSKETFFNTIKENKNFYIKEYEQKLFENIFENIDLFCEVENQSLNTENIQERLYFFINNYLEKLDDSEKINVIDSIEKKDYFMNYSGIKKAISNIEKSYLTQQTKTSNITRRKTL